MNPPSPIISVGTYRQLVAQSVGELPVISITRPSHQFETAEVLLSVAHLPNGLEDIIRLEREMLQSSSLVLFQVRLNLRLSSEEACEGLSSVDYQAC